jgi:hypothetical protein
MLIFWCSIFLVGFRVYVCVDVRSIKLIQCVGLSSLPSSLRGNCAEQCLTDVRLGICHRSAGVVVHPLHLVRKREVCHHKLLAELVCFFFPRSVFHIPS